MAMATEWGRVVEIRERWHGYGASSISAFVVKCVGFSFTQTLAWKREQLYFYV